MKDLTRRLKMKQVGVGTHAEGKMGETPEPWKCVERNLIARM